MANNCSITLNADKLPKVINKVEYFLFQAMKQKNIDFFQLAENNPDTYLAQLFPVAKDLINNQIKEYEAKAKTALDNGKQDIAEAYGDFAANLKNITTNWQQVVKSIAVYSSMFKSKVKFKLDEDGMIDLSELADDEEAIYKKFIVDQAANELDPFDAIDKAVEIFIRSIPKDVSIPDDYGFNSNVDYPSFVRNLMADLEGSIGIEEIIQKLQDNLEKSPEYQHIIDMLQFSVNDNSKQLQLKINFRNSFAKANIPIYTTSVEGGVIKVFEATVAKRTKYEQITESNFLLRGMPVEVDGKVINLAHQENGMWVVTKDDVEKIKEFFNKDKIPAGQSSVRKVQFLKALGFTFSPKAEEFLINKFKDKNSKVFSYIYNHFINRLSNPSVSDYYAPKGTTDVITNPIKALREDWNKEKTGQGNSINGIIELELKSNPSYNIERSIINPEGNRQHSTQLNNNFTIVNKFLSDAEAYPTLQSILESEPAMFWLNPETNPGIRDSLYLNSLFYLEDPSSDAYGKRRRVNKGEFSLTEGEFVKINIVNTGGLQSKSEGNVKEDSASTTSLNEADKLLQDINMFMKGGFSSILRLGDKTTDLGIFSNYYADSKNKTPYKRILGALDKTYSNVFTSEEFTEQILKAVKDITSVKYLGTKGFYEELDFASKNILTTWGEFDKVLSKNTKQLLEDRINSPEITSEEQARELLNDEKIKNLIKQDVAQYFKTYSQEFLNRLAPIKQMVDVSYLIGGDTGNFKDVVEYYLASSFLMDLETMKLFFGPSLHFKEFTKRASKDSATGNFAFLEPGLIDALNDYENAQGYGVNTNLSGRLLAERLFTQGKITNDQRIQVAARQIVSKQYNSAVIQDVEFNSKHADKIIDNIEKLYADGYISDENYELFKQNIKSVIIEKYEGKEGDGQGYVTFDFYRIISILTNNWGAKQEEVYKKIVEYSHYDDLAQGEKDETKKAEYFSKRDAVGYDPAEQVYFPPKKFQYAGSMNYEKTIDGEIYNALIPVFDKFSLYPLIPTVIKGTENEDLAKRMEFEGVGYVKFKTGSKTETPKKQDSLYVNYDPKNPETRYIKTFDQRLKDGDTKFLSEHILYNTHLKEQVRIDSEVHEDVIFGSQPRKLILMNILSLTTTHNKEEFTNLYNKYKGLIDDLVQIEKTMIYDKLGIDNKGGTPSLKNITKLVEYFTKEINKKNQDSNVLKAIRYDEKTGKFNIPLDASVQAQIIEGIVISSINNNIVRYKASGSMLTQVAITGSGSKKFSKDASEKALETFGNTELKYYDILTENKKSVVTAMQVKVGLTKQWLPLLELNHTDQNKIGSIERLNEMLKNKTWVDQHRKSIRMVAYRIPTQGRNFMDVMEVAEFLPAQFGDAIIMPTEAIIKSGSDFDIDKMFVFYPNMSSDGTYAKAEYNKNDLKRPDADLYKSSIQNKLYETMAELILHPNNYMELVTPSANFHIDPIVNALYKKLGLMDKNATERPKTDYKHTDILNRNKNIEKFLSLLNGKSDLGIAALANTFNVLFQIAEAKGNPEFLKNVQSFFSSKFMSKNPDNSISSLYYGDIYDEDGVLKSEFFSEFINSFVDVARDDYVFGINVVTEFSPIIFYMKFSGLSSKKILAFINQPILRAYTKNLSKYENMFVQNYINKDVRAQEQMLRTFTDEEKAESEEYKIEEQKLRDIKASARKKALAETIKEFGFTETKPSKYYIKKTLGKTDYTSEFTAKNLYNNIQNLKTFTPSQLSQEQKNFQLAVLYEMLNQKEQSDSMTDTQRFLNFDTKPYVSNFDVYVKDINYQDSIAKNSSRSVLSSDTIKRIKKDSVISSLDVAGEIRMLLETLFPVRNNNEFNEVIYREALTLRADILNKNVSSEEDMLRFARTAKNDFMTYLLQNFFDKSEKARKFFTETFNTDKNLNEYLKELIETNKLQEALLKIKNLENYEDIIELYPMVENLVVQAGTNNKRIITYRFLENSNNPVEKQSMIYQFEEIVNITSEESKQLKDLFKDLTLYSVFQSGYNTSSFSYTNIAPVEIINSLYAEAVEEFQKLTPEQKSEEYKSFFKKFKKNNPGFYSTKKSTDTITGEISKKGKWYSDMELDVKRPEPARPKEELKVTENNSETYIPSYYVDAIKAGTKLIASKSKRIKSGVYKAKNPENNTALIEFKLYKQLSALHLDTDVKKEAYAKSEGYSSWARLVNSIETGKSKVLKPGFLTGEQIVYVYKVKYLPEGGKATQAPAGKVVKPTIDLSKEWKGDLKTRPVYTAEGVNTMRTTAAKPNEHFGNPFSEAGYGDTIKVSSIGQAVVNYKDWLLGNKFQNVKPEQRNWILDQINQGKLDGAKLLYAGKSAARGEGMHPTALAEVVEQLRTTQAPVSQTNKPKGEQVKEGIYVNQEALTKEEQLELFNYLKPYLEEQAAKTNKGAQASKMIGLGLRWDYKSNNPGKQAVNIPDVIQPGNKDKYGYYNTSINGQSLGQITSRFRELMEKATGVDMTHYDGAIINLYDNESFISTHNDVDESKSAINYPVIGINLGGTGNFSIESRDGSPKQLNLKAGSAYTFGVNGTNREVFHRTFAGKQDSFLPKLTTKLDGKTYEAGSYRVTVTMRRVMPLTESMPKAPSVNIGTPSGNPLVQAGVKPGVEELFESNLELATIGTQEQYSQYLDTIFPDSKVKDIVYHASEKELEGGNFNLDKAIIKRGFIFFTPKKSYAEEFMIGDKAKMNIAVLNIKNPYYQNSNEKNALSKALEYLPLKYDGLIHSIDSKYLDSEERVVRKPEQIYILGSKQDIEGFKKYVEKPAAAGVKKYTIQDLAAENKGKVVDIQYSKYKTSFKATVTGEVELVSESFITNAYTGEKTITNRIYAMSFKTSTGKIVTADPYYEVKGLTGVEKLSDDSFNETYASSTPEVKSDLKDKISKWVEKELPWKIETSLEKIEEMYEKEKLSGETVEEFLYRMSCLGKIK